MTWITKNNKSQRKKEERRANLHHLVHRHHFVAADVQRLGVVGTRQAQDALDAVVDQAERARLLAIAPHLHLTADTGHGGLAAKRGRRLLAATLPRTLHKRAATT